jgi:hypothetical protein
VASSNDSLPAVIRVSSAKGSDAQIASVRSFVDRVGWQYGAQSVLEGPADGASTERGGHSRLLFARGVAVTVAISRAGDEAVVRAGYARAALDTPEIRLIPEPLLLGALPQADMVVSFDAPRCVPQWQDYVAAVARAARKVLVMVLPNPDRLLFAASHPRDQTSALARVLWSVGRVREHAYLGVPSWVLALQGAPAESVVQSPAGVAVRLAAPLHAFVVDTSPRTPQARRRLGLAASA